MHLPVAEIPSDAPSKAGANEALLFVLHGVTDAPALTVRRRDTKEVLVEGLSFGQFSPLLTVPAEAFRLDLIRSSDQQLLGTYAVDYTEDAGQVRTLALTGFLDPEGNGGGPRFAAMDVDTEGQTEAVGTANEAVGPIPQQTALTGHYPNPVSSMATLEYTLAEPDMVRLAVYDLLGREVAVLVDGRQAVGRHAVRIDTRGWASGSYAYRLAAGSVFETGTLQVVR
jgi:hypothetical protein